MTTVLITHPNHELYGSDRQLLTTVDALVAAGMEVVVMTPPVGADTRSPLALEVTARGAHSIESPLPVLRKTLLRRPGTAMRLLRDLSAWRRWAERIRQLEPDVVLVNTLVTPTLLMAARRAGVPSICHVHESESQLPRAVRIGLAAPLKLAREVICNGDATRELLLDDLPSLASRARTVDNGVPTPQKEPPRLPAVAPQPLRVALVGRISPRKGTDVAVEAVARRVAEGAEIELDLIGGVFAGYEWFEEDLRNRVARHGIEDRVRFHGFRNDVWELLDRVHVALVPSRVEPFGNVAVEGLARGRVVVASRTGGLERIVRHGLDGYLVPPDDPSALAERLASIAEDWAGAIDVAARGPRRARHFGTERYASEMVASVERVARGPA